jgi:hypothetical protein
MLYQSELFTFSATYTFIVAILFIVVLVLLAKHIIQLFLSFYPHYVVGSVVEMKALVLKVPKSQNTSFEKTALKVTQIY